MDDNSQLQRYEYARDHVATSSPYGVLWSLIGAVVIIIALAAGLIASWNTFVFGANIVAKILVVAAIVGIPGVIIFACIGFIKDYRRKQIKKDLDLQLAMQRIAALEAEELRKQRAHEVAMRLQERTIVFDHQGNAGIFDPDSRQIVQLRGQMREHPNLTSYHNSPRVTGVTEEKEGDQALINPPMQDRALPQISLLYDAIKYNTLCTAMGVEAVTGNPVIAPIVKSTHFKLIGGSGMGKSCVSAAILDIATTMNDPDHLRIGLLDLEHNTSRLFENLPHVAEIGPKRQRLVGRDPDEVAQKLKLLQWELTRRAQLGEEYCKTHEPILLVYVEEMLALKYEVVDKKLNQEMLAAINILGVRARKYGIFLLVCMQTDYSDKSTREAMAQFRTRGGFAIDPDTARASGFFNTELINQNFKYGRSGQYVLEKPQFSALVLAPDYDVAAKLEALTAPSQPTTDKHIIPLRRTVHEVVEGDIEGEHEADSKKPLRSAPKGDLSSFTAQEQRIILKFKQEHMGIGQIVSSEYTDGKGKPLTGGQAYVTRTHEVQDVIRRYLEMQEVS
jgi:FtsK/SpoIIIE family